LDLGVVGVVMDSYYQPILSPVKQKPTGLLVFVELLPYPLEKESCSGEVAGTISSFAACW